ncbi:hypothetical protein CS542_10300 [Pedobacter sp. IW39]|nr:hypothetical protein CS542_10300 [Pedobacter sp. IW39]
MKIIIILHGLTPSRDECEKVEDVNLEISLKDGLPMARQFLSMYLQYINFTDPTINKVEFQTKTTNLLFLLVATSKPMGCADW